MGRLYRVATKTAPLRVGAKGAAKKPVIMAKPIVQDPAVLIEATIVLGRLVGLRVDRSDRGWISIRYDDGGTGDFEATLHLVQNSAVLIGHLVTARVTFERAADRECEGEIESIEARGSESDFLALVKSVRQELAAQGVKVDAARLLSDEEDEANDDDPQPTTADDATEDTDE